MAYSQLNNFPNSKRIMQVTIRTSPGRNRPYDTHPLEMCYFPNGEPCLKMRKIFEFHVTTPDISLANPHLTVHALPAHNAPCGTVPLTFGNNLLSIQPQRCDREWVFNVFAKFAKVGRGPRKGETPNLAFLEFTLADGDKHITTSFFNVRVFNEKPQSRTQNTLTVPCVFASFDRQNGPGSQTPSASPFYAESPLWCSPFLSFNNAFSDSKSNFQFTSTQQQQYQAVFGLNNNNNNALVQQTGSIKAENGTCTPFYPSNAYQEPESHANWAISNAASTEITNAQPQWALAASPNCLNVESVPLYPFPSAFVEASNSVSVSHSGFPGHQDESYSYIPPPQHASSVFEGGSVIELIDEILCEQTYDAGISHQEQPSMQFAQDFVQSELDCTFTSFPLGHLSDPLAFRFPVCSETQLDHTSTIADFFL